MFEPISKSILGIFLTLLADSQPSALEQKVTIPRNEFGGIGHVAGIQIGVHDRCIDDRSEPVSDVESYVRTMESCHMCNIALMLGHEIQWEADKREFKGDDQAKELMTRPRRKGFSIVETS